MSNHNISWICHILNTTYFTLWWMKPQSLCRTCVMHISVKNPHFGVVKTNISWNQIDKSSSEFCLLKCHTNKLWNLKYYAISKVPFIVLWTWLRFDNFNCLGASDTKINVNSKFNYKLQYHNDLTLASCLLIQNWIQK
jgi:hypothetical protein